MVEWLAQQVHLWRMVAPDHGANQSNQNRPDSSSLDGSWARPEQNLLRLPLPIYVEFSGLSSGSFVLILEFLILDRGLE
jgi:hypothetical protein